VAVLIAPRPGAVFELVAADVWPHRAPNVLAVDEDGRQGYAYPRVFQYASSTDTTATATIVM
jgi:hypothetical protein